MDQTVPTTEVRTRRLVIADEEDRPRIVAEVVNGVAELRVVTEDPRTHVLVYAGRIVVSGPEGLGLDLFVEGDSVARVHAWTDGERWHWKVTTEE
jgi:hypothetical protein